MGTYAYGKVGRAMSLTSNGWATVGGDAEPPRLLHDLATRNPDDRFVIVSTCRDDPQQCGFPPNVINLWTPELQDWYRTHTKPDQQLVSFGKGQEAIDAIRRVSNIIDMMYQPLVEKIDGVVMWIGQHGTSNTILPSVTARTGIEGVTRPYAAFTYYAGGLFRFINSWRDLDPIKNEEVWLIADARNYLKARDQKWPLRHPVLGQFDFVRDLHHERFGDKTNPADFWGHNDREQTSHWKTTHTWQSKITYEYSGLELCSVTPNHIGHHNSGDAYHRQHRFGIFINEAGGHVGQGKDQQASEHRLGRAVIMKQWVLPLEPAFIHGKWTDASMKQLGVKIDTVSFEDYFPIMRSVKCTFTTPSSYSGWATTKPWEAFAAGTVCFRHPAYDTQDHIYGQLPDWCREWLSPQTPADLAARVDALDRDPATWKMISNAQYDLYLNASRDASWLRKIEERIHA